MANGDADWSLWSNPVEGILKSFDDQNTRQQTAIDRNNQNAQAGFQQWQNQRTINTQNASDAAMGGIRAQVQNGDLSGAQVAASLAGNNDLAGAIGKLADNHKQALADHADMIGRVATGLRNIPASGGDVSARQSAFDAQAPALVAHGLTPEEIATARANLSDQGLTGYINSAQSVKDLAAQNAHVADQQFEMGKQHDEQQFELKKPYSLDQNQVRLDGNNQVVAQFGSPSTPSDGSPTASPASVGSRPQRNNNPGNVKALPNGQQWRGQTGVDDGGFAMFGNPQDGMRAADRNLASYGRQGINTVAGVVSRWAPPGDRNNTAGYIQNVAKALGVDPNQPLNLSDPAVRQKILSSGIFPQEGGGTSGSPQAPYQQGGVTIIPRTGGKVSGLTPEAIDYAANLGIANGGKVPPGYARTQADQEAITNAMAAKTHGQSAGQIIQGGQTTASQGNAFKIWNSGKPGTGAAVARSTGVAIEHLDQAQQAAQALQTGNVPLLNHITQAWAQETGKPAPTNFAALKDFVTDEVTKSVLGGTGGVADRAKASSILNAWQSPDQTAGAVHQLQGLMASQLHGLGAQYKQTTGRDNFTEYLTPRAQGLYGHGGVGGNVPPSAAAYLHSNPGLRAQFDAKYGAGTASKILGN